MYRRLYEFAGSGGCPAGANALWRCRLVSAYLRALANEADLTVLVILSLTFRSDTRIWSFCPRNAADVHDVRNCQRYA